MTYQCQKFIDRELLELIWGNTNDAIFTIGYDGRILSTNPAFSTILGWEIEDLQDQYFFSMFMNTTVEEHMQLLNKFIRGNDIPYYVTKRVRKDGKALDILASYCAVNKKEVLAVGMYKDFSVQMDIQRKLQASEDCYKNLVEFIPDAIFVEQSGQIIFVNQPAVKLMGANLERELLGKSISKLVAEKESHEFLKRIKEIASTHKSIVEKLYRFDGKFIWGEIVAMQIKYNDDEVLQVLVRDVTAKKNYEEQLEYLAFHDPLTGLSNRRYFTEQINQALEQAKKNEKVLGIMYIDIDKFKRINDSLGHDIGDQLLKQFAIRLKENVREGDILCRIGGDEFLVLLNSIKDKKDAVNIVSRLNKESQKPYMINNKRIMASSSIGISLFPQDGIDSKTLILRSDEALYQAKIKRNSYKFYEGNQI